MTILLALNFEFLSKGHFQLWNFSKIENWKPPKLLKWEFLTLRNQQKLISPKISGSKIAKFPRCACDSNLNGPEKTIFRYKYKLTTSNWKFISLTWTLNCTASLLSTFFLSLVIHVLLSAHNVTISNVWIAINAQDNLIP